MQLREATLQDMEELMAFYTLMNEVINKRTNYYDPNNAIFPSEEMVAAAISGNEQIVGIEDGKIVIACIINSECDVVYNTVKWNVDADSNEFWVIHALRVDPDYEGRGFAKQMLAYLIDLAPKRGIKSLRLDILEDYEIIRLYHHFDFQYVDTVEILYEDIGSPKKFKLLERVI